MATKDYCPVPFKYLEDNFVKKGSETSWIGMHIIDESLPSQESVIEKYGGTYWVCLSSALGVYQWVRTDSPTPKSAYLGYSFITTESYTSDELCELFSGVEWELFDNFGGVSQWVCTDYIGGRSEILPAYVGMVVVGLPDAISMQNQYGGTWVLLSNEDNVFQWQCTEHNNPSTNMPSEIGEIIFSTTLTSAGQVQALYGGTWELLSDEDGIYQYERLS